MDVALALVGATFRNGFHKNKILEFLGDGIGGLSVEYRMGIDVMTTESAALSSVWRTDEKVRRWLALHGREEDFRLLEPAACAHYDALVDFATVTISLREVYQLSNVEEPATGFGQRLAAAFASGWHGFVDGLQGFAVALAYGWVWVLLLIVAGLVVVRVLWRRRRPKAPPKTPAEPPEGRK